MKRFNKYHFVRCYDVLNEEMDLIVLFVGDFDDNTITDDVWVAFDSWYDGGEDCPRGEWVREKLEEKYAFNDFKIYYSEEWK